MPSRGYKYQIDDLKRLALSHHGDCLSPVFRGLEAVYQWRCNTCGERWSRNAITLVYKNSFCKNCSRVSAGIKRRSVTLEMARSLANSRDGYFLSDSFSTAHDKYRWCCAKGHEWTASYDKVKQGRWCPSCGRSKTTMAASYTLADIQKIARSYGGKLLDATYKGIDQHHNFLCVNGHKFRKLPSQLTKSSPLARNWCPKCSKGINISEQLCRSVIEVAFKEEFPNQYPGDWLRNERGHKMQLDGYSPDLHLAFEYQGQQHSRHLPKFGKIQNLEQRQIDDALKMNLCSGHGVKLVQIPHFPKVGISLDEIVSHIKAAFLREGIEFPPVNLQTLEDSIALALNQPLRRLKLLAEKQGGALLSKTYQGMASKYNWRCSNGHEWSAQAASINSGTWCPNCAGNILGDIERMKILAISLGGKCLSSQYENSKSSLSWECGRCAHVWVAAPSNVYKGHWCPKCAERRSTVEAGKRLVELCDQNKLKIVLEYTGSQNPIEVECLNGHRAKYSAADYFRRRLSRGEWRCPQCLN